MAALEIRLDTSAFSAQCAELSEVLEGLPELVADGFLGRLHGLLSDGANCRLLPASVAGDHVGFLQLSIVGLDELIAAARGAQEFHGIGHGGSHAK